MIKFSRMLQIDGQFSSERAFSDCIGDQYLYARNPVYAHIRNQCLDAGFAYSAADTELWRNYQICSLLSLHEVLEQKTIPYVDNAPFCRRLVETRNADYELPPQFILQTVKRNYLLHESCHCLAHAALARNCGNFGAGLSPEERFVRTAILGEAFATAVERMGWALADSATHAFFYNFNSYVDHLVDKKDLMNSVLPEHGFRKIFEAALLGFLALNVGQKQLTAEDAAWIVDRVCADRPPEGESRERLERMIVTLITLNLGFLEGTCPAYFRLLKCEREFKDLVARYKGASSLEEMELTEPLYLLAELLPAPAAREAAPVLAVAAC